MKITELTQTIEQLKKQKENTLNVIKAPTSQKVDINKQLAELKEDYEKSLKK